MNVQPKTIHRLRRLVLPLGIASALVLVLIAVTTPKASHAFEEKACFDWECGVGPCFFNAGCSLPDAGFIAYRWDWGDGTGEDSYSETINHSYNPNSTHNVKLTILAFGAPGESVTCAVKTAPPIGPPGIESGHCE